MELFHVIDDGVAILRLKGGIMKQTKIYRREGHVYAPAGGGYLRLTRSGGTLSPNITWIEVEGPNVVIENSFPKWVEPKPAKPAKLAAVRG